MTMSVLDHLTQIQNAWQIALLIGIGGVILVFIIGVPLSCIIKDNKKLDALFTVMTIVFSLCALDVFGSLAGLFISSGQVSRTNYYAGTYDIERMADDYNARIIEDDRQRNSYLVHYEGYGEEEWIYYIGKTDPQAQYLISEE
jgi:hypothetical protein